MSKYEIRLSSYCCFLCHVRVMSRFCQGHVRFMSGSCQGHVWVMSGLYQCHIKTHSGSCQVDFRIIAGQFKKNFFLSNIAQPWRLKGFSVLFSLRICVSYKYIKGNITSLQVAYSSFAFFFASKFNFNLEHLFFKITGYL